MSKIEVLRVPDERMNEVGRTERHGLIPEGTLCIIKHHFCTAMIYPNEKPALLAALLEDAGAAKFIGTDGVTEYWLLPTTEDTKE